MKSRQIPLLFLMFIVTFSACSSKLIPEYNSVESETNCITFESSVAFPLTTLGTLNRQQVLPSYPWREVLASDIDIDNADILVNKKLALISGYNQLIIINLNTNQIHHFSGDSSILPSSMFLDDKGDFWGMDIKFSPNQNSGLVRFSKYKTTTNTFDEIFLGGEGLDNMKIIEKKNIIDGKYVFFSVYDNENIRYLLQVDLLEKRILFKQNISDMTDIVKDNLGHIWFTGIDDSGDYRLFYLDPSTQKVFAYQNYWGLGEAPYAFTISDILRENENQLNTMFYDNNNRLWIGNVGWFDLNNLEKPVWNVIFTQPEFLIENPRPEYHWNWAFVYSINETSVGEFFFNTSGGTISLDMNTGEWCKFTTASSNVYEDKGGALWIFAYGKLFKLEK